MSRLLSLMLLSGLLSGAAAAGGCSPAKPKENARAQVSGAITFDKQPLKTGNIVFDPNDGTPPSSFDILDGKYEGRAPVGQSVVRISSYTKMSIKEKTKRDGPGYDSVIDENMLPPRYNMKSEIKREVVADGPNVFNFDLEKK